MKKLLIILLFPFIVSAQYTAPLTQITIDDSPRQGAGANMWFDRYAKFIPTYMQYNRWNWYQFQTGSNSYDFSVLAAKLNQAIDAGRKLTFRIMTTDDGAGQTVAGGRMSYPSFLHTIMQTEGTTDFLFSSSVWVPNYNSNTYLTALENFIIALNTYLNDPTHAHSGKTYKNAVYAIDISGFGNFDEWHTYGIGHGTTMGGTKATDASQIRIINAFKNGLPNFLLTANINMLRCTDSDVSAAVGAYALGASNARGPFGWRNDHLADLGDFNVDFTVNTCTSGSVNFKTATANIYKVGPYSGEIIQPNGNTNAGGAQCNLYHLLNEVNTYHISQFSNVNMVDSNSACEITNIKTASRTSGGRLTITTVTMSDSIITNANFSIKPTFQNIGVCPYYEPWNVTYEFWQAGVLKVSFPSTFQPQNFLPGSITPNDNHIMTGTFSGVYDLYVRIADPTGYWPNLPLQITGRQSDGRYLLRSGIAVAKQGTTPPPPPPPPPNIPPTAFAGPDQVDTLPQTSDTLVGLASDADGDALTLLWTQSNGPNTATITSPTALTTTITGLIAGAYSFRLTANDGRGGIGSGDVAVKIVDVVLPGDPPTPPVYVPPTVTIRGDTTIQFPADSAYLVGLITDTASTAGHDTTIASVQWILYSYAGSTVGTIVSSTSNTSKVTGLSPGVYQYRFKVTDKAGNIVTKDFRRVFVSPVNVPDPIPLPVAPISKVFPIKKS